MQTIRGSLWTSRQRQGNPIHEISYRACFKAELPAYFIERFTEPGQRVYDPFGGRGTTAVEAALMGRPFTINDVNPLMRILTEPRIQPPSILAVEERLKSIDLSVAPISLNDLDLTMFYSPQTLIEIQALRHYLMTKKDPDMVDKWIRMVATNRLTGHSKGFFSVYTLPPNQAVTQKKQLAINEKYHNDLSEYRDVKEIILKKTKSLLRGWDHTHKAPKNNYYFHETADHTPGIEDESVDLIVTSPPFLNTVNYMDDNWLRNWFNGISTETVAARITNLSSLEKWENYMDGAFREFHRVLKNTGRVAFEVGEVRKGKVPLEEAVLRIAGRTGFEAEALYWNEQFFTKTSNIWGVSNNSGGTNSNRIVVLRKA